MHRRVVSTKLRPNKAAIQAREIRRRRRKNRRQRTPQLRRLLRPAKRPLIHGHQRLAKLTDVAVLGRQQHALLHRCRIARSDEPQERLRYLVRRVHTVR